MAFLVVLLSFSFVLCSWWRWRRGRNERRANRGITPTSTAQKIFTTKGLTFLVEVLDRYIGVVIIYQQRNNGKENRDASESRGRGRGEGVALPIERGIQNQPEGVGKVVWGYAESGGVVEQGGVYAERGAP